MSFWTHIFWDIWTAILAALILVGILKLQAMSWRRRERKKQREREEKYRPRGGSII